MPDWRMAKVPPVRPLVKSVPPTKKALGSKPVMPPPVRPSPPSLRLPSIRQDEVVLRMANGQDGAGARADDPLGDTSQEEVFEAASSVRSQH